MVGLCCSSWQCAHLEYPAGNRKAFAPRALFKEAALISLSSEADFIEQRGVVVPDVADPNPNRIGAYQCGGVRPQNHPPQLVRINLVLTKPGGPFLPRQDDGHTIMNGTHRARWGWSS